MSLRIAFVDQPIGRMTLPQGEQPFHAGSIGLWDYHVARHCAHTSETMVFSRGVQVDETPREIDGVAFHLIPEGGDECRTRWHRRCRRLLRFGIKDQPTRPHFLSPQFFRGYTQQVAQRVRHYQCDIVSISNFSQMVPEIRRLNPNVGIHLHMHCEWLNQLDPDILAERLSRCDFISGCSQYIVELIAQRFPQHASKCFPLWNGVDVSRFSPRAPAHRDPAMREIVFVGRVSPEKGVHILLEAFNLVVEQLPQTRLTIVGRQLLAAHAYVIAPAPDPLVQALGRYYSRRHPNLYQQHLDQIPSPQATLNIQYLSDMPQTHLVPIYQRASVFVFPSLWNEPFGMPLIEAMACGVPVVSTCSGGIPEFVRHGENGLLVERGNANVLAHALIQLLNDPERGQKMGQAGRSWVKSALTWEHVATHLLGNIAPLPAMSPRC